MCFFSFKPSVREDVPANVSASGNGKQAAIEFTQKEAL
jgi:hypothetical protein